MGSELYQRAVKLLSDSATRDAYRQRAVALAWAASVDANRKYFNEPAERYRYEKGMPYFSMNYLGAPTRFSVISSATHYALPDTLATKYWELLQCEPGVQADAKRQEIAALLRDATLPSGIVDSVVYLDRHGWVMTPSWRGEWEREAQRLPQTLPESDSTPATSSSDSNPNSEGTAP
jgi:hypothetical protein